MTPSNHASLSRPSEYDRHDATKHDNLLESTLHAYEVEDLTERDLAHFLAEVVFKHVSEEVSN